MSEDESQAYAEIASSVRGPSNVNPFWVSFGAVITIPCTHVKCRYS